MLTGQSLTVQVVHHPSSTVWFSGGPGSAMPREFPAYVKASLEGTPVHRQGVDQETAVGSCLHAAASDRSLGFELPAGFRELAREELGRRAIRGELPNIRVEQG